MPFDFHSINGALKTAVIKLLINKIKNKIIAIFRDKDR